MNKMKHVRNHLNRALTATFLVATLAFISPARASLVTSTDVPKTISDFGIITSVLTGPNLLISDINLVFSSLIHTCMADLHIELTSPGGTNSLIIESFPNNGFLTDLGCPNDFINTVLDDDAATNLVPVVAPWTGSFNVAHSSVGANPLSVFDGENAPGTWTLLVRDDAGGDTGSLNGWGIDFTGTGVAVPEPATTALFSLGIVAIGFARRRRCRA